MIPHTFDEAFERVKDLVNTFKDNEREFLAPSYSEVDVRKDFIDKFWIALGWDVNHDLQKNPYKRQVKVENNVNVEGRMKKADYAFLAPNFRDVRFFVEAKKPSRNIDNPDDYFQTVRYGWNAGAQLSVLTDFEQFRLLDCRYKPDVHVALQRAVKKFHFTEYADKEKFGEIYFLLSRQAVNDGALEEFAAHLPKPTGKATQRRLFGGAYKSVDEDFLQQLDELRDELARSFKNRNTHLNGEELTEATQRTLDRLVFMRFLEDKLIEPEAMVERLGENGTAWADFVAESRRLNRIYNGIIFKHHAIIDDASFVADERVFAGVRERLAHTNTSYNFNYIPIHVLGSIYERFLGKVIVATDKRARVEEKPEVRKAGGVYYTPEYVVRGIVEQTIGKLVEGKTPEEIAPMKFADIACGSGSFLLGMYDELLRYHAAYYNEPQNRKKALKAGCIESPDGRGLRLSLNQRKDILLNNIYGVDLDAQAVEVAQLSLFLKLLEEETTASAKGYQLQFRETMLPSLDRNVVHGNSLIGWDVGGGLFGDEEERKLCPMDFKQAFPDVTRRGGFDAIVGNPPYVRQESLKGLKSYFRQHYQSYSGTADLFVYFLEKGVSLLRDGGLYSVIVSSSLLRATYAAPLRKHLSSKYALLRFIDFGGLAVFENAKDTYVCVPLFGKQVQPGQVEVCKVGSLKDLNLSTYASTHHYKVKSTRFAENDWNLDTEERVTLIAKLREVGVPLGEYVEGRIYFGIKSGLTEAFVIDKSTKSRIEAESQESAALIKKLLSGQDIRRYYVNDPENYLIAIPNGWTRAQMTESGIGRNLLTEKNAWNWFSNNYSPLANHLSKYSDAAKLRSDKGEFWWELRPCDYYDALEGDKIIYPDIAKGPRFYPAAGGVYVNNTAYLIGSDDKYLLGLLNSRVGWFAVSCISIPFGIRAGEYRYRLFYQYMEQIPVRPIDFSKPAERTLHDKMVSLVEQMLDTKEQLRQARADRDRNFYENKCAMLDRQIDMLVYELYGLSVEEIKIVECSS